MAVASLIVFNSCMVMVVVVVVVMMMIMMMMMMITQTTAITVSQVSLFLLLKVDGPAAIASVCLAVRKP